MPWFRIDDGLPEHPKSIALWKACGKQWDIHAVAGLLWRDMGCDCSRRKSEGRFERERAYRVVRAPEEIIDKALAALVEVGFMTCQGDDFVYHDWTQYNPTREEIDARRAEISAKRAIAGSKGGTTTKERREQKISTGAANEQQTSSKRPTQHEQGAGNGAPPIPHSPFPNSPPPTPPVAAPAPEPGADDASDPDEGPPGPDPVVVTGWSSDEQPSDKPRRGLRLLPAPADAPVDPLDAQTVLAAIADAPGSKFDPLAGSSDVQAEFCKRLRAYRVTAEIGRRMGILSGTPKDVWVTWKSLNDGMVRMAWAMGRVNENGSRDGTNLSVWIARAKASLAADARRAQESAVAESRRQAALAAQATPARPAATAADAAASRPAFMRAVTPAALPNAEAVTHG